MNALICIAGLLILAGIYGIVFAMAKVAGDCDDREGTR